MKLSFNDSILSASLNKFKVIIIIITAVIRNVFHLKVFNLSSHDQKYQSPRKIGNLDIRTTAYLSATYLRNLSGGVTEFKKAKMLEN